MYTKVWNIYCKCQEERYQLRTVNIKLHVHCLGRWTKTIEHTELFEDNIIDLLGETRIILIIRIIRIGGRM